MRRKQVLCEGKMTNKNSYGRFAQESFHCDNNICISESTCVIHSFFYQLSESSMFCMFCIKPIILANNNVLLLVFRQTCKSLRNEVVIKYSFAKNFCTALY